MTKSASPAIVVLTALTTTAIPVVMVKQTSGRRQKTPPTFGSRLAAAAGKSRYDPQMARVCEKSCAVHIPYKESELARQPNAPAGALAHCPVSGVVFRVRDDGPRASAGSAAYHFCCNTCAKLFREAPDRFISHKSKAT